MWKYNHNEELFHYGIPGMKWGKRKGSKRASSDDHKRIKELSKKRVYELSNAELKEIKTRGELEKNYRSFKPSTLKKGVTIAATTAAAMGSIVALKNNGRELINMGKSTVDLVKNIKIPSINR